MAIATIRHASRQGFHMTKDRGFNYDRPAKTEFKGGGRMLSYAFDGLFPFILLCIAYLASSHYFLG
ncbi:MAG: hypothetical protein ACTHLP_04160 [Rhizobiaceae bacterium]